MSTNIDTKFSFYVKLYYEFGGSIEWLREEIIKKRYDSFRYLLPIEKKERANIVVEIYSPENSDEKYMNITSFLRFANIVSLSKIVFKNYKISQQECNSIYNFLKETYYEK